MPLPASLRRRRRRPEIMDQPDLDAGRHIHALRGLERINRWSGSTWIVWPAIRELARATTPTPLRVLDVATGGGDIPTRLWLKSRRAGLPLEVDGCDRSLDALQYARQRTVYQGARVRFFPLDAVRDPLPTGYQVIVSSLFLHHLDEEQARTLLRHMAQAAGRLVLINDLRRSFGGFALAYLGTRLLSTSEVVHIDGPRSVEAAFTVPELRRLAADAGLAGAKVERRWPCRMLLTWRRP